MSEPVKTCTYVKKNGDVCGKNCKNGGDFCERHSEEKLQMYRIAGRLGGRLGGRPPNPKKPTNETPKPQPPLDRLEDNLLPSMRECMAEVAAEFPDTPLPSAYSLEALAMIATWNYHHTAAKNRATWHRMAIEAMGRIKEAETAASQQPLIVVLENLAEESAPTADDTP